MVKFLRISIYSILVLFCFSGCFKDDIPIEPVEKSGVSIKNSIYTVQSFFDLSENKIVKSNPNESWDLAFETQPDGWLIRINYASLKGIYHTGVTDFNQTSFSPLKENWIYDASSGNPDSTAVGNWKQYGSEGPQVLLIGTFDGDGYQSFKKLIFKTVNDTSYQFSYANLNGSNKVDKILKKDTAYNFIYYSLIKNDTVVIEPQKHAWDILFTQYITTLFESNGNPAYNYPVRGIYINPFKVEAVLDTVNSYSSITDLTIGSYSFSSIQDYIGYNWKSVEVNQSANSATYNVRKNYSYVIKDNEEQYYKLRFLSFVNDSLVVGYPKFETSKLK